LGGVKEPGGRRDTFGKDKAQQREKKKKRKKGVVGRFSRVIAGREGGTWEVILLAR